MGLFLVRVVDRLVIDEGYTGPRWPFLYAFGEPPSRDRLGQLRTMVDALLAEEGGSNRRYAVPRGSTP